MIVKIKAEPNMHAFRAGPLDFWKNLAGVGAKLAGIRFPAGDPVADSSQYVFIQQLNV